MEKFTQTTVEKLLPGDRFYFVNDKKKLVYEVIEHKAKMIQYGWLSTIVKQDTKPREHVKKGREVIFLRHTKEPKHESVYQW